MTPISLDLDKISEVTATYEFNSSKSYRVKDTDIIANALSSLIYGDESVKDGSISFAYTLDGDNYRIKRDFALNQVFVTLPDGVIIDDADQTAQIINNAFPLTKEDFCAKLVVNGSIYNDFIADPAAYINVLYQRKGLTDDKLCADYEAKKEAYELSSSNLSLLNDMVQSVDAESVSAQISEKETALKELNAQIEEVDNDLRDLEKALKDVNVLKRYQTELSDALNEQEELSSAKAKIERSEAAKQKLTIYDKNQENNRVNSELEIQIKTLTPELTKLQREIEKGKAAVAKREQDFIYHYEKVQELNKALDEFVANTRLTPGAENTFSKEIEEIYAPFNQKCEELKAKKEELSAALNTINEQINASVEALSGNRLSYITKRAIREGVSFEKGIEQREAFVSHIKENVDRLNARLNTLAGDKDYNTKLVADCRARFETIAGKDATLDSLVEDFNKQEFFKQTLYRNQILISTLQREITAVDKKIMANKDAAATYQEDADALIKAKTTLMEYIVKLAEKTDKLLIKDVTLKAKFAYFDELDKVEFGDKCPVCHNRLTSKTDVSAELNKYKLAIKNNADELAKAKSIDVEYKTKLEQVNTRLGDLKSRVDTSYAYIDSLKQTKQAKLDTIAYILKECGMKDTTALNTELEKSMQAVSKSANMVAELRRIDGMETSARENADMISKEIDSIVTNSLPQEQALLTKITEELDLFRATYDKYIKKDLDGTAFSHLESITESEELEDSLMAKLKELYSDKNSIGDELNATESEYVRYFTRSEPIEKDGVSMTYPELIAQLIRVRYNEIIGAIRKEEEIKQTSQDELVAIKRVLEDKQTAFADLAAKTDKLISQVETNNEVVSLINKSSDFDPDDYSEEEVKILKQNILTEEQTAEFNATLSQNEQQINALKSNIKAIKMNLGEVDNYLPAKEEALARKNDLAVSRDENEKALRELLAQQATLAYLVNRRDDATSTNASDKASMDFALALKDKSIVQLISLANAFLTRLDCRFVLKQTDNSFALYEIGGKEKLIDKADDKQLILVSLALLRAGDEFGSDSADLRIIPLSKNTYGEDVIEAVRREFSADNNIILASK